MVDDERDICDCLEQFFAARGFAVSCAFSGEEALERLHTLDPVAYVRFASVYREFKDVEQFMRELKDLLALKAK